MKLPEGRKGRAPELEAAGEVPHVLLAAEAASISGEADAKSSPSAISVWNKRARADIRLSFLIHDVSRMRRAAYEQVMRPHGITRAQWWILAHLSRHDGMMQTQLADILEVGKASLGDVITNLVCAGLIERRLDPSDKRARRIFLTRKAQSLISEMAAIEVRFNTRVFGALSTSERSRLYKSLLAVKHAISELPLDDNLKVSDAALDD